MHANIHKQRSCSIIKVFQYCTTYRLVNTSTQRDICTDQQKQAQRNKYLLKMAGLHLNYLSYIFVFTEEFIILSVQQQIVLVYLNCISVYCSIFIFEIISKIIVVVALLMEKINLVLYRFYVFWCNKLTSTSQMQNSI